MHSQYPLSPSGQNRQQQRHLEIQAAIAGAAEGRRVAQQQTAPPPSALGQLPPAPGMSALGAPPMGSPLGLPPPSGGLPAAPMGMSSPTPGTSGLPPAPMNAPMGAAISPMSAPVATMPMPQPVQMMAAGGVIETPTNSGGYSGGLSGNSGGLEQTPEGNTTPPGIIPAEKLVEDYLTEQMANGAMPDFAGVGQQATPAMQAPQGDPVQQQMQQYATPAPKQFVSWLERQSFDPNDPDDNTPDIVRDVVAAYRNDPNPDALFGILREIAKTDSGQLPAELQAMTGVRRREPGRK